METNLIPLYSPRKSFYNKARVERIGNVSKLFSYGTHVATFNHDTKEFTTEGYFSNTTSRHQIEFAKQCGIVCNNKIDILRYSN